MGKSSRDVRTFKGKSLLPEGIVSLQEIREFVETSQSRIIPERVAEMLTSRTLELEHSEQREELFLPLIENLQERLSERGNHDLNN